MSAELRKIERLQENGWEVIRLQEVKKGDRVRFTESDEDIPFADVVAESDAYIMNVNGEERWGIEANNKGDND